MQEKIEMLKKDAKSTVLDCETNESRKMQK